jgi:hypothetical protein
VEEEVMSKFQKVAYSLPDALVARIQAETAERAKVMGTSYGVQTSVVRQAIEIGLTQMAKKRAAAR